MQLKSTVIIALVLLAVVASAAFAASPAASQSAQVLLTQIFAPAASTAPAPTPAGTLPPPVLNSICSPCTQAQCTRICHQTAFCSFDPDTGCSFCSCFLN
jgi:hypothetical protein